MRFWSARVLTTFATQIVSVAVGWQIYDLTRNPLDLGIADIVQFLPSLLLVLVIRGFAIVYNWNLPDIAIRRKP